MTYGPIRLRVLPALLPNDGRPVQLQATDTFIQWRYEGDATWIDLIALSDLIGPIGPGTEFRSDGEYIQYRAMGDVVWINLISIGVITGPQGDTGPQGPSVADGNKGDITVSGSGATWVINPLAVTEPMISASLAVSLQNAVADRTVLKALDTSRHKSAYLAEVGREGGFVWRSGDYSAQIASDSLEGFYVKATAIAATAGAWVRALQAPANVRWFGAVGNGSADDTAPIQAALNAHVRVKFPAGDYILTAPLLGKEGAIVEGDGYTKVRLLRSGVWNGDTLTVSGDAQVRGLMFEQLHPGFISGTSSTMVDRLTNNQAHIAMIDGTGGVIEQCWVKFAVFGIKLLATTHASIRDILSSGAWDELNGNVCEMKAPILVGSTIERPFNTEPHIERFYIGGGHTAPERPITIGTVTFNTRLGAGCRDAILVEGSEGLHIKNGYLCANRHGINLESKGHCSAVTIEDNFIDAPSGRGVFVSTLGGQPSFAVNISKNKFNGQLIAQGAIQVDASDGISLYGGIISDNLIMNHTLSPVLLSGAKAVLFQSNIVNNYHCRGGLPDDPGASSGLVVGGSASNVEARDNFYGGGANVWGSGNGCKWGEVFGGAGNGRSGGANAILGIGGGAIVSGITPLY